MIINIVVKRTGCKKTEIIKDNGILEMNVKGRPENGEANMEIIKFLSKKYKCSAKIVRGLKSRKKMISVGLR
ncbi:MAG: DUF167 domain-containing protein [Nanoarchaeota archaeon]|nr:DUF167 domain-containing protein [Nanoarchaeota archaeon]